MIRVHLTKEMKDAARDLERQVSQTDTLKYTENYTGVINERRYYYGYLGELVFQSFLHTQNKKFAYKPSANGLSDKGDFTLTGKLGGSRIADVKTAAKSFHKRIMIPQEQFKRFHYDFYIGVKICEEENIAEIWGYCQPSKFIPENNGFTKEKMPTMYAYLNTLTPIDKLLDLLADVN